MTTTRLIAIKEAKIRAGYPSFSSDDIEQAPETAGLTKVLAANGQVLGVGYYDPAAKPKLNIFRFDDGKLDYKFFAARIKSALQKRQAMGYNRTYRLIHGQADGLPGLIVDQFEDHLVLQVRNSAMEHLRELWFKALLDVVAPKGVYERSDVESRTREGLAKQAGVLHGEFPQVLTIKEDGLEFDIPIALAQKTGFYLDQRDNRRRLEGLVQPKQRVLDVYSYVGGFALRAARAGAYAMAVDKDMNALSVLDRSAARQGLRVDIRSGDALVVLKEMHKQGVKPFDHILLDPPTLIKRQDDLPKTKELLVQLLKLTLKLLSPNGYVWLSSCAYHLREQDLMDVLKQASAAEGKRFRMHAVHHNPADHPWVLNIPETLYLKTVVVQLDSL